MLKTSKGNVKFMETLDPKIYRKLERMARKRGLIVQELLRAIVIPEWIWLDQRREAWLDPQKPIRRTGEKYKSGKRMESGHGSQKGDPDVPTETGT